ncbi:PaaI family thioesterase [Maritalea porphyrae]|uniref:PaaI family thioesterase n=1 Tax=Maritalea porphyrae TaxID=880732 RepID=UPI0022AEE7DF|nr:PaaI family thioesterase [Maritalea porphyrae]MCZ4271528.1 PaaI family thioesterase [Maritalea porphyrae]
MIPAVEKFEERVRKSFALQAACKSIGLTMRSVEPGKVVLDLPFNSKFTQQHGFMHAGIITTALDTACGYAAFSLMPEDAAVLSVEFKTSLLRPASGETFTIVGRVIKPGKNISFCEAEVIAFDRDTKSKTVATMTATMMAVFNPTIRD